MADRTTYLDPPGSRARAAVGLMLGVASLTTSVLLSLPWLLAPLLVALASLAVIDARAMRSLVRPRLWIGIALLGLLPVVVLAPPDKQILGVGISTAGALMTAGMVTRVMTAAAALLLIGTTVGPMIIRRVLVRLTTPQVAQACAIGLNLMPKLVENVRRTSQAMRLRGGWRRRRIRNLARLMTAVGVQTVRMSQECAEALLLARTGPLASQDQSPPTHPSSGSRNRTA